MRLVLKVILEMLKNRIVNDVWKSLQKHLDVSQLTNQGLEDCTASCEPSVRHCLFLVTILSTFFHVKCEQRNKYAIMLSYIRDISSSMTGTLLGRSGYRLH